MSGPVYYRSQAPEVAAWHAAFLAADEKFRAEGRAFNARYPSHHLMAWTACGRSEATGLRGYASPGDGWRESTSRPSAGQWVPRKSYAAAKALAAELTVIRFDIGPIPGLPKVVFGGNHVFEPGFEELGGWFWSAWAPGASEPVEAAPRFDPALWTRAKASEYWTAREADKALPPDGDTPCTK